MTNIEVYTDGSSLGVAPYIGDAGWAFVACVTNDKGENSNLERGGYLENATNNVAELTAILEAVTFVSNTYGTKVPLTVITDSRYCEGLLFKTPLGWEFTARKNVQLIAQIRSIVETFTSFSIKRVKGHSCNIHNNRADVIAGLCRRTKQPHVRNFG